MFAGDCVAATDQGLIETFFGERDKLATVGNVIVRAAGNSNACGQFHFLPADGDLPGGQTFAYAVSES